MTIPKGYRKLRLGERLRQGDKFWSVVTGKWRVTGHVGERSGDLYRQTYIRRA